MRAAFRIEKVVASPQRAWVFSCPRPLGLVVFAPTNGNHFAGACFSSHDALLCYGVLYVPIVPSLWPSGNRENHIFRKGVEFPIALRVHTYYT